MSRMFSYSKLNMFTACPRQYRFHYIDKIPVEKTSSANLVLGDVVHRVLRRLYQCGADGVLIPPDEMLKLYDKEWEAYDRSTIVAGQEYYAIDDFIRLGRDMLNKHYEAFQPFDQGELMGTEAYLTYEIPGTDFNLRGYIDRYWRRDDGLVEICDYKTGQTVANPHDKAFFYQMGIYQLMVQQARPDIEEVELAQYFLRRNEVVRYRMRPDELDMINEELRTLIVTVLDATRLDDFPTKEGWQCDYCDFRLICPAKRHELLLNGEIEEKSPAERTPEDIYRLASRFIEVDREEKRLKTEKVGLKEELADIARQQGLSSLQGEKGTVKVSIRRSEKFITKTRDEEKFHQLNRIVRSLPLDEFLVVDTRALMKEGYAPKRLDTTTLEALKPFVIEEEQATVRAYHKAESEPDVD